MYAYMYVIYSFYRAMLRIFHPNFGGVPVAPDRLCWGQHAHRP